MTFAYADPPYPGCALKHYADDPSGIRAEEVDHPALLKRLAGFDRWALSTHVPALRDILPICPDGVRVGAWVKPFVAIKMGVRVPYAWEPVIFFGSRKLDKGERADWTTKDWISAMPPVFAGKGKGTKGQKPTEFSFWVFDVLGVAPDDEFHDLFPGSKAVSQAWEAWRRQRRLPLSFGG